MEYSEQMRKRWEGVIPLVEHITAEEGATVTFGCANPDFNGLPNEAVTIVRGPNWTEETWRRDTLVGCLAAAVAAPPEDRAAAMAPDLRSGLNEHLVSILGLMNYQTGPLAHGYQAIGEFVDGKGEPLAKRCEEEQAFILHKLLVIWLEHGDDWRKHAVDEFDRVHSAAKAAKAIAE